MSITLGVDVSSHQDPSGSGDRNLIDWAEVGPTDYDFALARMSIGRGTVDEDGRQNLRAMLGIVPVPGAYGVVGTSEPVEDGAKLLVDEIAAAGADPRQILVMLDAEDLKKRPDGTVPHPTIGQVDRYAQQLHAELGRWPVAYVPDWWLQGHGYSVAGRALANCPWAPSEYFPAPWTDHGLLAHKPTNLLGFKSLGWLQFTSSGTVPGITGRVDLNCYYGTLTELRAQLIGGTVSATGPASWDDADWKAFWSEIPPSKYPDKRALTLAELLGYWPDGGIKGVRNDIAELASKGVPVTVTLTPEQFAELKASLPTLEGSALISLALSPPRQ